MGMLASDAEAEPRQTLGTTPGIKLAAPSLDRSNKRECWFLGKAVWSLALPQRQRKRMSVCPQAWEVAGFSKRRPELLAPVGPGTRCSAQGLVQTRSARYPCTTLGRSGWVPEGWHKDAETGRRRSQVASRAGTPRGSVLETAAITNLVGWNQTDCLPFLGLGKRTEDRTS